LTIFQLNYIGPMADRPRYYANDGSRDFLALDPRVVEIEDGRSRPQPPALEQEGFALIANKSTVRDFGNDDEINRVYGRETQQLLQDLTGADEVVLCSKPVRRTTETSRLTVSEALYNARPANFVHVDISNATAAAMAEHLQPKTPSKRFAHYNLWRVYSAPPQDMPLALCDFRSVSASDLVAADAMMDIPGKKESSYEGLVVRYNPRHRWSYFSGMHRDEVLVFRTEVPHAAFNNTHCRPALAPRASIEMRAIAYWNRD
jgi:hypothetical protein